MASSASCWRTVLVTVIVAYGVLILGGVGFIYSGAYDIGSDAPHWGFTHQVFETARARSIKAHAAGITPPGGSNDEAKVLMGTEHFADHCAVCHGAPGVPMGDLAHGLYPQPPDLAVTSKHHTDAELFWIVKHGIKMTGMPGWSDHNDDQIWATVVFLRRLPGMTPEEYSKLVMAAVAHGGHSRGGLHPQGGVGPSPEHEHGPAHAPPKNSK